MPFNIDIDHFFTAKYKYDCDQVIEIAEDKFECKVHQTFFRRHHFVTRLIHVNSTLNYFECEIVSKGERGYRVCVGIGPEGESEDSYSYYEMREYGLYCEADSGRVNIGDGLMYHAQGHAKQKLMLNLTISEGDRIGCGIDFDSDHHSDYINVFFTQNGKQVGDLIRCKTPPFKMCPVLGVSAKGGQICLLQHCSRPCLLRVGIIKSTFSVI